jgi:hypothetical protein
MDSKSFLKEIRSIIREEIEYALQKQSKTEGKKASLETLKHGLQLYKEQVSSVKQKQTKPTKPTKAQTPRGLSIQSILDETRRSLQENYVDDEEYPEMRFNSSMVAGTNFTGAIPDGISEEDLTPEVAKALTRDYSALMARLNEKKNGG